MSVFVHYTGGYEKFHSLVLISEPCEQRIFLWAEGLLLRKYVALLGHAGKVYYTNWRMLTVWINIYSYSEKVRLTPTGWVVLRVLHSKLYLTICSPTFPPTYPSTLDLVARPSIYSFIYSNMYTSLCGLLTVNEILLLHLSREETKVQGYARSKRTLMRQHREWSYSSLVS